MTSTEIVPHVASNGRVEREWIALLEPAAALANQVAGTGFVPTAMRNNPAAIVAAILYGDELGLGPMQALAKIAVIEGKPTLYAEAQRALILAAGHELWIDEASTTRVTISGRRHGSERTSSVTWTLDDAKRAGLAGRSNWRTYPRQMLTARATAELARAIFADVIGGLAATEEIEDVDPLALPLELEPEKAKTTRRRRRRTAAQIAGDEATEPGADSVAPAEGPGEGEDTGSTAPDLPPLPDEPAEPLLEPAEPGEETVSSPDEPGEPRGDSPADDSLELGVAVGAEEDAGEVAEVAETTTSSETSVEDVASPADKPTQKMLKALDALVGKLRETEVELEDGTKTTVLSTAQLWAATATRRNVSVDVMIELLGGKDEAGVLHWTPLRDSLTRSEASDLISKLEDRARKWGVE